MRKFRRSLHQKTHRRPGVAAVEFAIAAPVLVLLLIGAIDVGQFVNSGQVISNASRVGARRAARFDTVSTSEVYNEVLDYLEDYLSGVSRGTIDGALTVNVKAADGTTISGANLGSLPDGAQLRVEVLFNYSTIRWLNGFAGLDGQQLTAITYMRRL